jgi:DNA repair protein RAD57
LIELLHEHPLLVGSHCNLDNIQTSVTKSVDSLLYALSEVLPALMRAANARSMPLKLLVIDSLAELLLEDKVSTATLADRSRNLSAIAAQLHALATTRQLAVLAINRVTDVWDRRADADPGLPGELIYAEHAKIFGRAEGASKSAALGLVWANQINARIMLARTERRRALPARESSRDRKRQRAEDGAPVVRTDDVVVRRLSVVFSAVCAPAEVDFIIAFRGVESCDDDVEPPGAPGPAALSTTTLALVTNIAHPPLAEVSPLDVGSVVSDLRPPQGDEPVIGPEEDEEDAYWRDVGDFTAFYESTDLLL